MQEYVIYLIQFPKGKLYVGQTKNFERRSAEHLRASNLSDCLVDRKIVEVGSDNISIEILEVCESREQLNLREKFWIKELRSHVKERGYNVDSGGWLGKELSAETRKKIAKSKVGEKNPMFGRTGPNKGKKMSEETKQKMRKTKKENPWVRDEMYRAKISKAGKGHLTSDQTKQKISKANKGKPRHSEESKKRISEQTKGKHWYTDDTKDLFCRECPGGFHPGRSRKVGRKCQEN